MTVYDRFLGKITDDMYMELTPLDTLKDLQNLLVGAIDGFEFPRIKLDYTLSPLSVNDSGDSVADESAFEADLTSEEINILAILMMQGWTQRQVTSIEHIRMKYSGQDFKFSSQANHLSKLLALQEELRHQNTHMQRLYKRRKLDENGQYQSNWSVLIEKSALQ